MGETQGLKEIQGRKVQPARREPKASKECPDPKVPPARRGLKGRRVRKGEKGDKGDPATVKIRAVQADGAINCDSSEALVSVFCPSGGAADGAKCGTSPTIGLCMKK
ncbi:hypothetical protein ACVWXL_004666 [Bradyrhizobium sp. GM22.5]